ncbi:ATP-dependent DNA helicase RecG [Oceanicoccus sagamiensis]|uniref:ATP-dependent DNA helicase RecG n=1 Tax=Oceanicoccus sagamiensis TaxID=716816 RepID=A0A1X9NH69_9GAMM|nr:ATP-dependent DNA helicase RecG [Oceanicoccus sagamiensis]ARN76344.1 ATP-dependent DNA helicase RecG [Oceanicoccus sagamiensis]
MSHQTLDEIPVQQLKGVGPKMAEKLAGLSIRSVQDLLFHLPLRYQDRTRITPIGALQAGADAVIEGEVKAADIVFGRRRSLVCRLQDGTGTVTLRFFHFSAAQKNNLSNGTRLRCFGEARRGSSGLELYHPEYTLVSGQQAPMEEALTPIYPSSEGLSQQGWRKLSQQALNLVKPNTLVEWLPQPPQLNGSAVSLEQALLYLHRPPTDAPVGLLREGEHPYQQRLAFEELLAHNLSLLKLRSQTRAHGAPPFIGEDRLSDEFLQELGFALTGAQQRVVTEINHDLKQSKPMLRLVQGDVGSGKTVVAALAALKAVACGYQVAIMAPTEILAEQHFTNFGHWMQPLGLSIGWLTGKVKGKQRKQQLEAMLEHQVDIVIGTHALFQDEVQFAKLGLAIIDEQHRFGVHQRLALKEKASADIGHPHQLIMTATPIPRTLAMSAYADLDTSVIDELPPGRTPVTTVVIDNARRAQIVERVRNACSEGRQTYWVCTLIEESEALEAQAAEDTCENLQALLPELNVGLIHGRMKADEKASVMQAFKENGLDLLVATTVIEVGVDVPNASLMIIENAERLGLAQLHQLRGRVGRGSTASHCVLMYQSPLGQQGKQRLQTMRQSSDGFVIAEKDLELRGPGELLGTRQTGLMQLRIADLERDSHLLEQVKVVAEQLLQQHPNAVDPLIQRWLADGEQYAQV